MIRLLLYILFFYILYKLGKNWLEGTFKPRSEVKGRPKPPVKQYNPEEIEDIDYQEVKPNEKE